MNSNSHHQTSEIASIRASKQPPFAPVAKAGKKSWSVEAALIGVLYHSYGFELPDYLPSPFHLGYDAAACAGVTVTGEPAEFHHQWLQLRVEAWHSSRVLEVDVTPDSLRAISLRICPITDFPLTYGTGGETDLVYVRLCPEGDYSLANLGVLSSAAALAMGDKSFVDLQELADLPGVHEGLTQDHWRRLVAYVASVEGVRRGEDIFQSAWQSPRSRFSTLVFLRLLLIRTRGLPAELLDRLHAALGPVSAARLERLRACLSDQPAYGANVFDASWPHDETVALLRLLYEGLEVAERQAYVELMSQA
jgi:hypothetical protein